MGLYTRNYRLFEDVTTAIYSDWIDVGDAEALSIHVDGIVTNDKIKIFISNLPTPVVGSQVLFGSELTANGITPVTTHAKWLRVYASAIAGGGTLNIYASKLVRG